MQIVNLLSVGAAAVVGAWLRWGLGMALNPLFPTIPLGTLAANLTGGFLMGLFMGITRNHALIPESARLAIATGFLGSLTTFSTFSAETVTLLANHELLFSAVIIVGHVAGTLCATLFGIYTVKIVTS